MTPRPISRRAFSGLTSRLAWGALAGLALPWSPAARAQFRVEISGVGATQIPISLQRLRDEDKSPVQISAIVRADLERSGLFRFVEGSNGVVDENSRPAYPDWRAKSVDALAAGSIARLADGQFDVRYRLWDVIRGTDLGGKIASPTSKDNLRRVAHEMSDFLYEKLLNERGVFSTRIAYVSKAAGRYTLWVADADGEGAQVALAGPEPIMSPSWSPDARELAYVSFEERKAVVYVQDVYAGKRRVVANFKGSNSAPAWSPDGSTLAVTLTRDGPSQIWLMNRNGGDLRRLTSGSSIDTEATWAPDGKSLFFVSDRGGGPQVYRVTLAGGAIERVTFAGNYNISPTISPDGRSLAYISRNGGNSFQLTLMDIATGTIRTLTDTNEDESPSFAPNGRLLIYATRTGGRDVLMTTTLDGSIKARLGVPQVDVREPTWGPFGR